MAFLSQQELSALGFASLGKNVNISSKASIYGAGRISIGSNVRIDDFAILSAGEGGIEIGNYIHIALHSSILGKGMITIRDFANISGRVSIYSSNDDYSGHTLTNPCVPEEFTGVSFADVTIGKHAIIGNSAIILPGVDIGTGCAIGAQALVKEDCKDFGIYAGSPAKYIKDRDQNLLKLEEDFKSSPLYDV